MCVCVCVCVCVCTDHPGPETRSEAGVPGHAAVSTGQHRHPAQGEARQLPGQLQTLSSPTLHPNHHAYTGRVWKSLLSKGESCSTIMPVALVPC